MGFRVIVEGGYLHFASSHFITYEGKCERLHGHNYALSIELEGPLTEDSFVFDFVTLKRIGREVADVLDHRFLLAARNPQLKVVQTDASCEIHYQDRMYVIPARDVKALPVDNITAERLAEYIWGEVAREISAAGNFPSLALTVGIAEAPGQTAYFSQPISR